jgi:hypothetical protein
VAGAVDLFNVEAAVRQVEPRPELVVREHEGLEVWVREEESAVAKGDAGSLGLGRRGGGGLGGRGG